jgi:hypothetical protein
VEQFRPVTDEDREGLTDLLEHHGREVQEFLAAISARPIIGARRIENPADIRAAEAKRLRDQRAWGTPRPPRLTNWR